MKILNIAYYTILRNFRDKHSIITMVFFPIFIIAIITNVSNSKPALKEDKKIKVGFLNQDKGYLSNNFEDYMNRYQLKDYIEIINTKSKDEGVEQIKNGNINSLIIFENGYTDRIKQEKNVKIYVYNSDKYLYKTNIVKYIVDSYLNEANASLAISTITKDKDVVSGNNYINNTKIPLEKSAPNTSGYFSITMLIMIIMYGSGYGASEMSEELFYSTGLRIRSTPVRTIELYSGKMLGAVFTIFLQGCIIILAAKKFYGVNWGDNVFFVLFIILIMSILSVGFGSVVALVSKDIYMANRLLNIITPIFTLISGGFMKFNLNNKVLESLRFFVPNQLAHIAIFNTVYNGSTRLVMLSLITMLGMIIINFVIAGFAIRRNEE